MEQKHIVIIFGILMALLLIIDIILIVYIVLDVRFAYEVYYHARRPDPIERAKPAPLFAPIFRY